MCVHACVLVHGFLVGAHIYLHEFDSAHVGETT